MACILHDQHGTIEFRPLMLRNFCIAKMSPSLIMMYEYKLKELSLVILKVSTPYASSASSSSRGARKRQYPLVGVGQE